MALRIPLVVVGLLISCSVTLGAGKYDGMFLNDKITVELKESGEKYGGTIRIDGKSYPLVARDTGRYLEGTFDVGNESFEFTVTIGDAQINLRSGGASHDLKRATDRTVPPNPLARDPRNPVANVAPAADPAGLKTQIEEIIKAAKEQDIKVLWMRVDAMKLPNHEAWFKEVFGPEVGGKGAAEYAEHLRDFMELQKLFNEVAGEGRTRVRVTVVSSPDDREARGLQVSALRAMKTPCPLYTVSMSKDDDDAGMSLWSFVFVDGAFRLVGDMKAAVAPGERLRPTDEPTAPPPLPPTPQIPPPSGGQGAAAPARPAGQGVMRFRLLKVKDELIGMDAYSLLIPSDWRTEGGMMWRKNPIKPATAAMRIFSPDGKKQIEILPQMPFVDGAREAAMASAQMAGPQAVAMMAARFAEGNLSFGNEVRRRVDDPAAFVKQFVIPRYRQDLRDLRIVKEEDLPKVAEFVAAAEPAEQGTRRTVRAGRTRVEFTQGGQAFEEDIYCVLVLVEIQPIRQTMWGPEHLLAFRAPKGELDSQIGILRTVTNSFRIDLKWYNKYVQLVGALIQGQMREIEAIGEFSRKWAQMSDEVSRDRQKSWEDRQSRYDEMNKRYSQYQRGVEQYKDANGEPVELPSGYGHGWKSRGGEYIVTENPNFNPNVELNGTWEPLEKMP